MTDDARSCLLLRLRQEVLHSDTRERQRIRAHLHRSSAPLAQAWLTHASPNVRACLATQQIASGRACQAHSTVFIRLSSFKIKAREGSLPTSAPGTGAVASYRLLLALYSVKALERTTRPRPVCRGEEAQRQHTPHARCTARAYGFFISCGILQRLRIKAVPTRWR